MSKLIRAAAKPFMAAVSLCTREVNAMNEPLKRHIDACEAKGEDVCAKVWREYVDWQAKLLPHRLNKVQAEFRYVFSGEMAVATVSWKDLLTFARFATTCMTIFLVFVMVGRGSVFPPLAPTSPFVEEVLKNWQENHINNLTARYGIHFLKTNNNVPQLEE